MKSLADIKIGESGEVARILVGGDKKVRINEMGITVGAKIKTTRIAPLNDPIEIEVRNYRLCLRRSDAKLILLKDIEELPQTNKQKKL